MRRKRGPVALCAQPFGWLTLVEVSETVLLPKTVVQRLLAEKATHVLDLNSVARMGVTSAGIEIFYRMRTMVRGHL